MKELYFLRHGKTNFPGRYIGASDVPLSKDGEEEILKLLPFLEVHHFDYIFCSPMQRCLRTYQLLFREGEKIIDERIREVDFGRWENKTFAEICLTDPDLIEKWNNDSDSFSFPDGEKTSSFRFRIREFTDHIASLMADKVLVISHGGVIRHLLCHYLNIPYDKYIIFQAETGKLSSLQFHGEGAILTGFNRGEC